MIGRDIDNGFLGGAKVGYMRVRVMTSRSELYLNVTEDSSSA